MIGFATIDDVNTLFRPLNVEENERAAALLPIVSACIRQEAMRVGKDIDTMLDNEE